jgi:hypothetical protein
MSSVVNGLSGWTGAVFALLAFAFAFGRRSPALGVLGAALSAPFCLCAKGYPIVGALAWAALISNFIAACIVGLRRDIAVAALTPFGVICAFLAVLAIRGIRLAR